jgi:hypothetical protein
MSSCNAAGILTTFQRNLKFLDRFSKNTEISKVMKIHRVRAELFCADAKTHMTNLVVAFHNFGNKHKNGKAM